MQRRHPSRKPPLRGARRRPRPHHPYSLPAQFTADDHEDVNLERPIFDWTSPAIGNIFKRAAPLVVADEEKIVKMLERKVEELTPSKEELTPIHNFYDCVYHLLQEVKTRLSEEVHEVFMIGSFLKGTEMVGHLVGDMVISFRALPTSDGIKKVIDELMELYNVPVKQEEDQEDTVTATTSQEERQGQISYQRVSNNLLEIHQEPSGYIIKLYATTPSQILCQAADLNPEYLKPLEESVAAVRHAGWFQHNCRDLKDVVPNLIRVMKDLRRRFSGLSKLNVWHLELVCHCAVIPLDNGAPFTLPVAFRRILQLLSAGLFLPGALSIPDHCENDQAGIQSMYTPEDQDEITRTSQIILRLLHQGRIEDILAIDGASVDLTSPVFVNGVIIQPSKPIVFDKVK